MALSIRHLESYALCARIAAACLALVGIVIVTAAHAGTQSLSNKDAGDVIERAWNEGYPFVMGQVSFVRVDRDLSARRAHMAEWSLYKDLAQRGLIAIPEFRDLSKAAKSPGGGWDDFLALSQGAIQMRAVIVPTPQGKASGVEKKFGDVHTLLFKVTSSKIDSVVANDEISVGVDKYRIVQGTHTWNVPEGVSSAMRELQGWDGVSNRRFRALLKFDPIDKAWRFVTADVSPRSSDFTTNQVNRRLQSLGWSGSR